MIPCIKVRDNVVCMYVYCVCVAHSLEASRPYQKETCARASKSQTRKSKQHARCMKQIAGASCKHKLQTRKRKQRSSLSFIWVRDCIWGQLRCTSSRWLHGRGCRCSRLDLHGRLRRQGWLTDQVAVHILACHSGLAALVRGAREPSHA